MINQLKLNTLNKDDHCANAVINHEIINLTDLLVTATLHCMCFVCLLLVYSVDYMALKCSNLGGEAAFDQSEC